MAVARGSIAVESAVAVGSIAVESAVAVGIVVGTAVVVTVMEVLCIIVRPLAIVGRIKVVPSRARASESPRRLAVPARAKRRSLCSIVGSLPTEWALSSS